MQDYQRADMWRRGLAYLLNMWLLLALLHPLKLLGINDQISFGMIQIVTVLLCTNLYWSPGKWIFKIKVLRTEKELLNVKERIIRNLPNLLIIGISSIPFMAQRRVPGEEFSLDPVKSSFSLVWMGIFLFWISNMFTAFFDRKDRTLMDMKLDTFVGMPRKPMKFKPIKL